MNITPINFLFNALDRLALEFPFVRFSYAYNEKIDVHVVQIEPLRAYYENEALDKAWIPIALAFEATFTEETVCFISSDSTLAITSIVKSWNKEPELFDYNQFVEPLLGAEELLITLPEIDFKWTTQNEVKILGKANNKEVIFEEDFNMLVNGFIASPKMSRPAISFKSITAFEDDTFLLCAA
jgi:hypothetical protein